MRSMGPPRGNTSSSAREGGDAKRQGTNGKVGSPSASPPPSVPTKNVNRTHAHVGTLRHRMRRPTLNDEDFQRILSTHFNGNEC